MFKRIFQTLILSIIAGLCRGQDCGYPTTDDLEDVIKQAIPSSDSSTTPTVNVISFNPACLAFSEQKGLYRSLSVIVEYTCSGNVNCRTDTVVEQFESQCNAGVWSKSLFNSTDGVRSVTTNASMSTITKEDCAFCLSLDIASRLSLTTNDIHHCVECDWSCNKGHRRCFGLAPTVCSRSSKSACCNFYHNSVCVDECPNPYTNDSDNDCVCPVGTTGNNCEDVINCGCLENPGNGSVSFTDTTYSSTATYSCNTGYTLTAENEMITCLEVGNWSGSTPTCSVVDCGHLDDPEYGAVSLSLTIYDSVATYSCNTGYTLIGNSQRTCLETGDWSGRKPTCSVVDCGTLDDPEHGTLSQTNTIYESVITYSCDIGYNLEGDDTRICLESGDWSGGEPSCSVVDCGALNDPDNGKVSPSHTIYNSMATYSCNSGYSLIGEDVRKCQGSGLWSGSEPNCARCQVAECLMCDSNISTCDVCNNNKIFNGTTQECTTAVCTMTCKEAQVSDAEKGGYIAAIVILLLFILILVVIIIVLLVHHKWKIVPTNSQQPSQCTNSSPHSSPGGSSKASITQPSSVTTLT